MLCLVTILIFVIFDISKTTKVSRKTPDDGNEAGKYLVYHPPIAPWMKGLPFYSVNSSFVMSLLPDPVELTIENLRQFVFVSALSSSHFKRASRMIESIQNFFPKQRLIIYDLGLTTDEVDRVSH